MISIRSNLIVKLMKKYKITKENGEIIATSIKYPTIIGVGKTEKEAIKELNIFIKQYEDYLNAEELENGKEEN